MKSILAKIDTIALNELQIESVIEMAWGRPHPFDAIRFQFCLG